MSYVLDGSIIPRPKELQRGFLPISQDYKTINGRGSRDVRSITKESYILRWETLSLAEITTILGIVDKNIAVNFYVDEENLTISTISVIVRIGSIEYSVVGSNYVGSMEIQLEKVQ